MWPLVLLILAPLVFFSLSFPKAPLLCHYLSWVDPPFISFCYSFLAKPGQRRQRRQREWQREQRVQRMVLSGRADFPRTLWNSSGKELQQIRCMYSKGAFRTKQFLME